MASMHADRIIIQYLLQEFVSIHGDELGGFVLMFQSILHTACALPSAGIEQGTWKITSGRTSLLPGPHSLGSRSAVISRYWQGSNPALLATMDTKSSNSAPGKHGLEIKTARHHQGNTDKIDYYLAKQLLQASESPSQKKRASPSPVITRRMNIITSI